MGRSYTPTYRVDAEWNNSPGCKPLSTFKAGWTTTAESRRMFGHVNFATPFKTDNTGLEQWVRNINDSFKPGAVNEHVSKAYGYVPWLKSAKLVNQKTGKVVATYEAAAFTLF